MAWMKDSTYYKTASLLCTAGKYALPAGIALLSPIRIMYNLYNHTPPSEHELFWCVLALKAIPSIPDVIGPLPQIFTALAEDAERREQHNTNHMIHSPMPF